MLKLTEDIKEDVKEDTQQKQAEDTAQNTPEQDEVLTNEDKGIKTKKEKKDKSKEQIAKLEAELAVKHNEYLKVYAEMENTKRRLKEEAIKDRKYASQKVVGELINPIDMLVKIVNSEAPSPEVANYLIGFKMIAGQLMDVLKNEGLTEIESLNKEFNPTLMEAMSVEERNDVAENTVVKVMQTGYLYKDRVLRPAMVIVSKKTNEEKEEN